MPRRRTSWESPAARRHTPAPLFTFSPQAGSCPIPQLSTQTAPAPGPFQQAPTHFRAGLTALILPPVLQAVQYTVPRKGRSAGDSSSSRSFPLYFHHLIVFTATCFQKEASPMWLTPPLMATSPAPYITAVWQRSLLPPLLPHPHLVLFSLSNILPTETF